MKTKKIENLQDLRDFLRDFFLNKNKKVKVILFGSRARGNHSEHSDIDLAIDTAENIEDDLLELKGIIEDSNLPQKVDIVILSKPEEDFKEEILKEGKVWIDLTK